eukprot:2369186-Pleurochrysis_carterae.AAC.1
MGAAESSGRGGLQEVPVMTLKHDLEEPASAIPPTAPPAAETAPPPAHAPAPPPAPVETKDVDVDQAPVETGAAMLSDKLQEYKLTKRSELGKYVQTRSDPWTTGAACWEGAFAKVRLATSETTGHQTPVRSKGFCGPHNRLRVGRIHAWAVVIECAAIVLSSGMSFRMAMLIKTVQVAVKIIKRKKLDKRAELLLQREVKHHEKVRRTGEGGMDAACDVQTCSSEGAQRTLVSEATRGCGFFLARCSWQELLPSRNIVSL